MPISRKPTGITAILITDTGLMGANLRLAWASDDEPAACGHRPSLPDSLPVISRSPRLDNDYFGFGHGHLGLTMAAVTGATLAATAAEEAPPVDTTPYRIDRRY